MNGIFVCVVLYGIRLLSKNIRKKNSHNIKNILIFLHQITNELSVTWARNSGESLWISFWNGHIWEMPVCINDSKGVHTDGKACSLRKKLELRRNPQADLCF